MQQKTPIGAFTLIEILVGITIIGLVGISVTQFNFTRLSQKQQISIEAVSIANIIEEARNNALIGRSVLSGATLVTPASWDITISESLSGSIRSIYTHEDSSTGSHASWSAKTPFSLNSLECQKLDGSTAAYISDPVIHFSGARGHLTGCPDNTYKVITFEYGIGSLRERISVNVLTGVIEQD